MNILYTKETVNKYTDENLEKQHDRRRMIVVSVR